MKRSLKIFILSFLCLKPLSAALYTVGLDSGTYTSDFMMGKVVVSIIFPESDGSLDPNTENWSAERKQQAIGKIMAGLDWWTKQNPRSPLNFTLVTETVSTKYEPITRPYYDESLWVPDVMGKLGFPGSRFSATRNYVNSLRSKYKTDWGYVIFVVDSLGDTNGKFADGYFAYAYLGGPFLVMTYDNNGYGIANMDVVVAHESGHIFNALDQYAGASSPNDYSHGYFATVNGNHAYSSSANNPDSIMRGGIRWGLDDWARKMVGWLDDNKNGRDDIMDTSPTVTLSAPGASNSSGSSGFGGKVVVTVLPRQNNTNKYGLTLDTILRVEYRLRSDEWAASSPTDGAFDSAQEQFQFVIPASQLTSAQSVTAQDVDIKVVTVYSSLSGSSTSGTGSTGLGAPAAATLDNAHAYPNPFKPNSSLNHIDVTFIGLTPGAKVEIFTPAGEPVFVETNNSSTSSLTWKKAANAQGTPVASGVYYYLITDPAGHTKKGKLAVIR